MNHTYNKMQLQKNIILNKKYTIIQTINESNIGFVYKACDKNNTMVAIKEFFPVDIVKRSPNLRDVYSEGSNNQLFYKWRNQFYKEIEFLKILKKFNYIVKIIDSFDGNNTSYIVMEFLPGDNLFNVIKRYCSNKQRFHRSNTIITEWVNCLLIFLHNLHSNKPQILHCDLCPQNIVVQKSELLDFKIIDFGLARFFGEQIPYTMAYTPGFSSPEQFFSDILYPQSDYYSLGATLYYAISGKIPSSSEERYHSSKDPLVPIEKIVPDIYDQLARLINTCLSMDHNQRPDSIETIRRILQGKTQKMNMVTHVPITQENDTKHILSQDHLCADKNLCPNCFEKTQGSICGKCYFDREKKYKTG